MDTGLGRNIAAMTNNPRSRDFTGGVPLNGTESDRSSHSTLPKLSNPAWGTSIWNNSSSLGNVFSSTARDNSRPRGSEAAINSRASFSTRATAENGAYMGNTNDHIEGKTGSGSLVASSESDTLFTRSPWADTSSAAAPHGRNSGVSPARKRSIAQGQNSQTFADTTSQSPYFPVSRNGSLAQVPVAKPSKTLLDPTSGNFTSRQMDSVTNGFSAFSFGQPDTSAQRSDAVWPDGASVHSPSDDRRSVAASEYFGPSSASASRSGSLPPSRHGEPAQFAPSVDSYSKFTQANARQYASFSHPNGRPFQQERSGSIQSDSLQLLGRNMSLDLEADPGILSHRPSLSINELNEFPPTFTPSAAESNYQRDGLSDGQSLARAEDAGQSYPGSFTPDYTNGHVHDPTTQLRSFQFDSRSAPNGTAARQSPFYSHTHTPPGPVYDHLYPSRTDQTLPSGGNNLALVQSKLRGYQQQQEHRNFINPQHYSPQHFPQIIAANNHLRNPYGYGYAIPNGMHLQAANPTLGIPVYNSVVHVVEPPSAPRNHGQQAESMMSSKLYEFKQQSKMNKRFDLRDIYNHIVEFAGDQHGSRFIQQKLETANSDEKDHVFKELAGDSLQLMQDVFGNYVIQKFFEHGDQHQKRILGNKMKGHVIHLSLQMYGCRVVQKALEHVLTDQQITLARELEDKVLHCVKDQNGNHVIQKAIERVPQESIGFIIDSFRGNVGSLSVHSYGCRVVQRLLENIKGDDKRFILQELHAEGSKLIADQYGNYVTQHVIIHGEAEDKAKIIELVKNDLLGFSKHKFASNVVEKCLQHGSHEQRRELMQKMIEQNERGESNLLGLIKDNYGNYVIQKTLDVLRREDYDDLVAALRPEVEKAKKIISGKQVIAVEKKLHKFERIENVPIPQAQRSSMSSATDSSTEVPPLVSGAQSPQSSSLPSGNASTVDDPVHTTPTAHKSLPSPGLVSIAQDS